MTTHKFQLVMAILVTLMFGSVAGAQTTAFSYQGSLKTSGSPANGNFDFQFLLYDAVSGGNQIGATVSATGVAVTDGAFSASLDFGNQFPGAARFLEIRVQPPGGGGFTTLAPRQTIASTPYSVKSLSADNAINAANATTATNATQLGGVAASQFLQSNGNGSALTNLNAGSVTSGTLSNARLGQLPTANIADSAVTAPKVAPGQVVKGLTVSAATLTDNVTLAAGTNITLTPAGNTVTIASTSGGVGGSGSTGTVPLWNGGTALGNSQISQDVNGVQMPNSVLFAPGAQGYQVAMGSPNGETGLSIASPGGARTDLRFDGSTVKLVTRAAGSGPPTSTNGIVLNTNGRVGIGTAPTSDAMLRVAGPDGIVSVASFGTAVNGQGTTGVYGFSITGGFGVYGISQGSSGSGAGVYGSSLSTSNFGVFSHGFLGVDTFGTGGGAGLCINGSQQVSLCGSSSSRYKTNLRPYLGGLEVISRLQPVTFKWKSDHSSDVGFVAEEISEIEPLLTFRNQDGTIEGIKYDRLAVVFVNALKQQQAQIEALQKRAEDKNNLFVRQQKQLERQRRQIDTLMKRTFMTKRNHANTR